MKKNQYIYAVARIRAKETQLLSKQVMEELLACKTEKQCIQMLEEKGWEFSEDRDPERMLEQEREKTWGTLYELTGNPELFRTITCTDLFQNLKAAVKQAVRKEEHPGIFLKGTEISGEKMLSWIRERDFEQFPVFMREAAKEAFEAILKTGDGQLCDRIIDRVTLQTMKEEAGKTGEPIFEMYAESAVALADIKIAVRSCKTGKGRSFMEQAMIPCSSLDIQRLIDAAVQNTDAIAEYLEDTVYREGAEALSQSPSAFACWCDNQIIRTIRPQLWEPFSVGPLAAYAIARENEIKNVRIILAGKQSGIPDVKIQERIRDMYV